MLERMNCIVFSMKAITRLLTDADKLLEQADQELALSGSDKLLANFQNGASTDDILSGIVRAMTLSAISGAVNAARSSVKTCIVLSKKL